VNATSRYLRIPVSVKAENTLKIKVTGGKGAAVCVGIGLAESTLVSPPAGAHGKQ
jgi:hypothetical protein